MNNIYTFMCSNSEHMCLSKRKKKKDKALRRVFHGSLETDKLPLTRYRSFYSFIFLKTVFAALKHCHEILPHLLKLSSLHGYQHACLEACAPLFGHFSEPFMIPSISMCHIQYGKYSLSFQLWSVQPFLSKPLLNTYQ